MKRFLFVNYSHPANGHVSSQRLYFFGRAIAEMGNEVYLLTRSNDNNSTSSLRSKLDGFHVLDNFENNGQLLHCEVSSDGFQATRRLNSRLLQQFGKVQTAWNLALGPSTDVSWVLGAKQELASLPRDLKFDLAWATFTPIDCWQIASRFARDRQIPFVGDIKDHWKRYLPFGSRNIVSQHFRSAKGFTSNSIEQWPNMSASLPERQREVIYSGYPRAFLNMRGDSQNKRQGLVGCFFGRAEPAYIDICEAMQNWAERKGQLLTLRYWGDKNNRFRGLQEKLESGNFVLELNTIVVPSKLLQECFESDFNFYVRHEWTAIHHKATELMSARRPILVWGKETEETRILMKKAGIPLFECCNEAELGIALDEISAAHVSNKKFGSPNFLDEMTWEAQANRLYRFFDQVIRAATLS